VPLLTSALPLAERVHAALVSLSDGASVFTGCDELKRPLKGHRHAYIFCECDDRKSCAGEVTEITVYARLGFSQREQKALEGLGRIWGPQEGPQVSLAPLGLGRPEDFSGSALLARSRMWASSTPFLPTRHGKVTRRGVAKLDERGLQIGGAEHDLLRLLTKEGLPEPVMVERVEGTVQGGQMVGWERFVTRRSEGAGRRPAGGGPCGFRVMFPEAVQGPVAVGFLNHFALGGFRAED
jgi:CRISPR-associated protein Csb2